MPKRGVSVTLRDDNLLWLKGRARATRSRSLSETLDALVTAARAGGPAHPGGGRSVVGTVDIAAADSDLEEADAYLTRVFASSVARPFVVRENPPATSPRKPRGSRARRG